MEDLRRAALAYYNNSSPDMQRKAWEFFQSMDTDRDGRISMWEFSNFVRWNGYGWVDLTELFPSLDSDRDGKLDFWEVLAFYYIMKTRGVWCAHCGAQLHSLYFTCAECFDAGHAFDHCITCYSSRVFSHHHHLFLDSFILLRSKIGVSDGNVDQVITQPQDGQSSGFIKNCLMALEMALAVGNISGIVAACSIM